LFKSGITPFIRNNKFCFFVEFGRVKGGVKKNRKINLRHLVSYCYSTTSGTLSEDNEEERRKSG